MAKKTAETPFSKFFREESQEIFQKSKQEGEELTFKDKISCPVLPESKPAEDLIMKEEWKGLRKFFASSKGGGLPKDAVSIHLHPSSLSGNTYFSYPIIISGSSNKIQDASGNQCISLNTLLSEQVKELYPEPGQGNMIKKILPGILTETNNLVKSNGLSEFKIVFEKASNIIKDKMDLRGSDKELFDSQIAELKTKIPVQGALIPYSREVTLKILESALSKINKQGKLALEKRIGKILSPLVDILDVEIENNPEATDPEHLKSSIGFADHFLDFEKLSSVIPGSASEHISKERFDRIKGIVQILKKSKNIPDRNASIITESDLFKEGLLEKIFTNSEITEAPLNSLCSKAISIYEGLTFDFTGLIRSLRIGELEVKNKYIEEVHDDFFASFDWNNFSAEERSFCPPVILIADALNLVNTQLKEFSAMLHSSIPVNIVALRTMWSDDEDSPIDTASLVVSHRNTYVAQTTSLNPQSLFENFVEGLTSLSPSCCLIEISDSKNDIEALFQLSVSVESRYFPQFAYNGKTGTAWGSRFNITENSQIDMDWPVYNYTIINSEGHQERVDFPITCADFMALNSKSHSEFKAVKPEFWNDDLILLSEYLKLPEESRYSKIPFIWMSDGENTLFRAAVSWKIVMKATERLEYWHYLQDSGGINSFHTQKALKLQEEKILKEADKKIEKLKEEHLSMVEKVRKESTEQAMDHLTSALLDMDTDAVITHAKKPDDSVEVKQVRDTKEDPEKISEPKKDIHETDTEITAEEPWIETPLCTNCNECTDINNRMFKYNANKLAFIADPAAGTFAQLVEAAEKCPVSIIHPGKPLNLKEPDLEDLMERAKKFN